MSNNPFHRTLLQLQIQRLRQQQQNEQQQHLHCEQQLQLEHQQRLLDLRQQEFQQQQQRQQQQQQINLLLLQQQLMQNQQERNPVMQPSMLPLLSSLLSQQPLPPVNQYSHLVVPSHRRLLFSSSETTQAVISQNFEHLLPSVPALQSASSPNILRYQTKPLPTRQTAQQQSTKSKAPTRRKAPHKKNIKKKRTNTVKVDIRKKITKSPANTKSTSSSVRRTLVSKIDREPPRENWDAFSMRSIPTDDVLHIVQYHAYILSNVHRIIFLSYQSTSGGPDCNGIRVYACKTGINNPGCTWKITLRKKSRTERWNMARHLGKCTCMRLTTYSINVPTLINLPEFRDLVRDNMNGSKVMKIDDEALRKQLSRYHGVQNMHPPNFAKARRSVEQYLQTKVINDDFLDFPRFLKLLIELNKNNVHRWG